MTIMNRLISITILVLYVIIVCNNCSKEPKFVGIENISFENYPKVDGSTSASVLNMMVACKLLGIRYEWRPGIIERGLMFPNYEEDIPKEHRNFFQENIKTSQAQVPDSSVPKIAINGIFPDKKTVKNRTYPFISGVDVAIRSDLDRNSMAYKLYQWMQSESAKSVIVECEFIPK